MRECQPSSAQKECLPHKSVSNTESELKWLKHSSTLNKDEVREVYERAIAHVPTAQEKRFWRRYIYLWIYYALYEELVAKDIDCKRQVYRTCLELVPHKKFTLPRSASCSPTLR